MTLDPQVETARHEAGHAVAAMTLGHVVHLVTVCNDLLSAAEEDEVGERLFDGAAKTYCDEHAWPREHEAVILLATDIATGADCLSACAPSPIQLIASGFPCRSWSRGVRGRGHGTKRRMRSSSAANEPRPSRFDVVT